MKNNSNQLYERFAKLFILFLVLLLASVFLSGLALFRAISKEDICTQKAQKIVGQRWVEKVKVNDNEDLPYLKQFTMKDGTVFLGVKEMLKCEKEFKYFYLF